MLLARVWGCSLASPRQIRRKVLLGPGESEHAEHSTDGVRFFVAQQAHEQLVTRGPPHRLLVGAPRKSDATVEQAERA